MRPTDGDLGQVSQERMAERDRLATAALSIAPTTGASAGMVAVRPTATATNSAAAPTASVATRPAASVATSKTATAVPNATSTTVPPTAVNPAATATTKSSPSALKDGTYQGAGTSHRGGIGVLVTVQNDRIARVAITQSTTQYPVSRIAGLPSEVVARQNAQVDLISGATFSSQAFQGAVHQALTEATIA